MKPASKLLVLVTALATFLASGCAAIQHRNLETKVQMQNSIFIDPDIVAEKPIYIRVTNQTGKANLNFDTLVAQKITAKGYRVTKNSKEAGLRILANFLYLDKESKSMTAEGALAAGFGGLAGSLASGMSGAGGFVATGGSALVGAAVGSLMSVDKYLGVVDIQVEQPLQKAVVKKTRAVRSKTQSTNARQQHRSSIASEGAASDDVSGEDSEMAYEETVTRKQNRTRVVGEAMQTNIDEQKAMEQIKEQLADSIAGFL
jgi:hypothetical protein